MQTGTDENGHSATAIKLEDLQLSVEERDAVQRGFTIALTKNHRDRTAKLLPGGLTGGC